MSDVLLPVELRGELIGYITSACSHRPFGEVQGIVAKLAMLPAAPEPVVEAGLVPDEIVTASGGRFVFLGESATAGR